MSDISVIATFAFSAAAAVSLSMLASSDAEKLVTVSMYSFADIPAVLYASFAYPITVSDDVLKRVSTPPTSCSCAAYPSIAFVVSAPMAVAAPATAAAVAAAAALSAVPIPLSTLVNPENFPFASSTCSPLSFISFPISSAAFSAFSISSVVFPNSCSVFTSAAFW